MLREALLQARIPSQASPARAGEGSPAEERRPRSSPAGMPAGRRILVVDGCPGAAGALMGQLRRHGHRPLGVERGAEALHAYRDADLVLMESELPDLDGLEVCRAIRAVSRIPLIMVTSRGSELDCVLGLQAGADDYLVKPYGFRELSARIEAVLRRAQWQLLPAREIRHGRLHIDAGARQVTVGSRAVALTCKEFDLLSLLAAHPETVIPRRLLLQQVWGDSWSRRTLDTHVSSLRAKLGASGWVLTVRGVGFRIGDG